MPTEPTIVNVGYRSTNFWVISHGANRLLLDLGWPGMMGALTAELKRLGVPINEIRHGLATHYHMDHAGCAQDLKNGGMKLIVADVQVAAIPLMKQHIKPNQQFTDIVLTDNVVVKCAESRALLAKIGFAGEIVPTPGHSDDSISLLLDNGAVFTGDLTPPGFGGDNEDQVRASWQLLRDKGATTIYPAHTPPRRL